jgi:hypothetical protein
MFKSVNGKFKGQRKVFRWTVCPVSNAKENERYIQCKSRIARVNIETGKAILSKSVSGGAYFVHLNAAMGAKEVECPEDIINQLKAFDEENGGRPVAFMIGGSSEGYLNEKEAEELKS